MQPASTSFGFFSPAPLQPHRRRTQWVPLLKLQLSITEIISIFADFATLLQTLGSFHRSVAMGASRGGLCFFYSGEEQRGGYRLVRREEWRGGVAQLKEDMAVVGLANEEADYRNYDYEQWGEWLDALTQQWEEGSAEGSLAEFRKQLLSFSIYPLCYFPVRLPHSLFTERLRRSNLHSGLYCYTLFEAKNRSVWKKLTSKEAEDYRLKQVGNFLEHLQEKGAIIAYRRVLLQSEELLFGCYAGATSGDINIFSFAYQLPLPSHFPTSPVLLASSLEKAVLTARTEIHFELRYEIYKINKRNVTMVVRSTPHWQLDTCGFFAFFKKWEEFQCQWAQTYSGQLFDPLSFKVARVGEGLNMTTVVELLRAERNESWLEMVVKTVDRHLLLWLLFEERLERESRLFGKAGLEREERGVERELELALEWGGYLSDSLQELSRGQSTTPQEE